MARLIIPVLLFISLSTISYGQNIRTNVFTLDLGEPKEESLKSSLANCSKSGAKRLIIKSRTPLAFKLKNGNPYKYRYVINHKLVDFFNDQGYNPLDSVRAFAFGGATSFTSSENTIEMQKESLQTKADLLTTALKAIEEKTTADTLSDNKLLAELLKEKSSMESQLDDLKSQLELLELQRELSPPTNPYNIIKYYQTASASRFINPLEPKNAEDSVTNIFNALQVLKVEFQSLNSAIDDYVLQVTAEDFLNQDSFQCKRTEYNLKFKERLSSLTNLNREANRHPSIFERYQKDLAEVDKLLVNIKTEIGKMYQLKFNNYLLPVDIDGKNIDFVEVTLERYDKTASNPTPDRYTYNIWVKGGLKIDVSGGLFITSLADREYETTDIAVEVGDEEEIHKLIYEKDKGAYDFGFGSTINISLRGGSWVRPALSIGALFTANQKFQLLSGLGIILGKEERVVLHGGLSMGSIAQISSNFKADGSKAYDIGTNGDIPTTNRFTFGHFFGVTYNFSKPKKQDAN